MFFLTPLIASKITRNITHYTMYFMCNDGERFRVPQRIMSQLPDALRDVPVDQEIPVPFRGKVVSLAIKQHKHVYDFECWQDVIACCSFLNLKVSEASQVLSNFVTMEIVRASGINLFHFDEAFLFMNVLNMRDPRIIPVDRLLLERLYWHLVTSKSDLTSTVQGVMGVDTYEESITSTRKLREELTRPHSMLKTVR